MKTPIAPASIPGCSASASRRAATPFFRLLISVGMFLLLAGLCLPAHAQTGEWVWMGGGQYGLAPSQYGTLGTPAQENIPGARIFSSDWTDRNGHFWLFGGQENNFVLLNDLWEFNPFTNEWTWMGGSNTYGQPGVYGTLGTPAPGNIPGARQEASSWTDSNGNLWLFGGLNGAGGYLNDLWEFNPSTSEWTWMGGSSTSNQDGVYGTLGTPGAGNIPGARSPAGSWTDGNGHLWLFGGAGIDSVGNGGDLNDLWEFDPSTNKWSWMGGSSTSSQAGVYGTLGTPAPGNMPGARQDSSSWTDSSGHFWLFGGPSGVGYFNDLWQFNPSLGAYGEWAWMGGSSSVNQPSVYGTLGTPSAGNIPQCHARASNWTDSNGNFWLFGGTEIDYQYGDIVRWASTLWDFNPSTNEWTWMGGSQYPDSFDVWGTLGTPAVGNIPAGREGASNWTDSDGHLWLFGGAGTGGTNHIIVANLQNDLWEFLPDGALPLATAPTLSVPSGDYTSPQTLSISDTTPGAFIFYTLDGTTPTIGSARYSTALTISQTTTVNAIAWAYGYASSSAVSATYILPTAVAPVFTPPAGAYTSFQSVQISSTQPDAAIYYTLDGTTPTTGSARYSTPLTVSNATTVINAIAVAYGYNNSAVAGAVYTIRPAAPTFSLPSGEYLTPQSLIISDVIPTATIYYTTDGSAPSRNATPYTGAITIDKNMTIRATAVLSGYFGSPYASAAYGIKAPAPTFSLPSGEYLAPQSLTISAPGATIYYTTDGSGPSASSTPYTGAIAINKNVKIRATAITPGYANSPNATAAYGIKVPAPTFSLLSGIYPGPQQVTISDSMGSAAIYYTTDGTTPTASSTLYTGSSITVSAKEKIIAIATATGYANSPLVAAAYGIK
ncbi:MAG TPA: chitobiase/beta-hexosaminidase C-terminal domain-containing protein [Terracidiphilus sp.]|jgi:hypothetical protein|nr:chitobiase/beta-hexosaminidase C-terminal domain-containing protein [Terracidiphilus sp.]